MSMCEHSGQLLLAMAHGNSDRLASRAIGGRVESDPRVDTLMDFPARGGNHKQTSALLPRAASSTPPPKRKKSIYIYIYVYKKRLGEHRGSQTKTDFNCGHQNSVGIYIRRALWEGELLLAISSLAPSSKENLDTPSSLAPSTFQKTPPTPKPPPGTRAYQISAEAGPAGPRLQLVARQVLRHLLGAHLPRGAARRRSLISGSPSGGAKRGNIGVGRPACGF